MELKSFREKYNLTQVEFAKIIGVPRTTYQMWEYDWKSVSNSKLLLVEKAMRKIESEHASIEDAINRIQALRTAENENYIEEEYTPCKIWKYVLLLIIWVLIFAVLY